MNDIRNERELALMDMEDKLTKIRSQINSKLENQRQYALVLQTIEDNIKSQSQDLTPVAYFVSFMTLLDQCCKDNEIVDLKLASNALYFLDIIAPQTPQKLLRENFSDILIRLAPALTNELADAPLIRAAIGFLQALLIAQDYQSWKNTNNLSISPKRAFSVVLDLSNDPRPKIRKRATEAIYQILANPPASAKGIHPIANTAAEFALNHIVEILPSLKAVKGKKNTKNQNQNKDQAQSNGSLIHYLQLIIVINKSNSWPVKQFTNLCDILLEICKSADQYLISTVFNTFESLFQSMSSSSSQMGAGSSSSSDNFIQILEIIFNLKPSFNDPHLAPSWLAVISKAITCFTNNDERLTKLPEFFRSIAQYFQSDIESINESVSQCLISVIVNSINDEDLITYSPKIDQTLNELAQITNDLLSIKFRHCAKYVCDLITAMFNKFKFRSTPHLLPHLTLIGEWRSIEQEGFELNDVSESVIGAAIANIGPENVLNILPLNLTDSKKVGRAWLLPLLRDNIQMTNLNYYISDILPNVEFFKEKVADCRPNSINAKIFQTIIDQIWSILPYVCYLPLDLQVAFNDDFGAKLGSLLYSEPNLRPVICNALKNLVVTLKDRISSPPSQDVFLDHIFPLEKAQSDLDFLAQTKASKLLSILFNVFTETPISQRNFVSETIESYLEISTSEDLISTFNNVCTLLKQALDNEKDEDRIKYDEPVSKSKIPKTSITMMDLIVLMTKYIPVESHNALLTIFNQTICIQDVQIQKRCYRILLKLLELNDKSSIENHYVDIFNLIIQTSDLTLTAAKPQRMELILGLIDILPKNLLYLIPAILSEIIISTKSNNEKTRTSSYAIIIAIGHKLKENNGELIQNSLLDSDIPDSNASIKEFFTMCSAGLVGSTPHMISAAVTALSCLFYEFGNELDEQDQLDLFSNVLLFLQSNNREIIKPCLGFLKIGMMSMSEDLIKPKMTEILTDLMVVNTDHKNHFKSKIKHLIERLVRKFGMEFIEQNMPQDDRKLIQAIKKARSKSKTDNNNNDYSNIQNGAGAGAGGASKSLSAYERILYDDSDDEDGDDEVIEQQKKKIQHFISEGNDSPLDLLDKQALAQISTKSSSKSKFTKKSLKDVKTKNGKLVFNEDNGDDDDDDLLKGKNALDAYVEAVNQGPVRNARNKLKWKKKSNGDDGINWDDEDGDDDRKSEFGKRGVDKLNKRNGKNKVSKPKFKSRRKL